MSFFIALFPFDFECAKVRLFIGMAIVFDKNFYSTIQFAIFQRFTHKKVILTRGTDRPDRSTRGPAEVIVEVTVLITDDKLEAFDAVRKALGK